MTDPLLQELMAEFDEKFLAVESGRGLRVKNIFDGTSRIAKREDLKSFLTSAVLRTRERVVDEIETISKEAAKQIADGAPEGDWYLLPPNVHGVIGYISDSTIGEIAYKGKAMNMKAVIDEAFNQFVEALTALKETNPSTP